MADFSTPVDQLIPHIRRLVNLQCSRCPRHIEAVEDVSTALIARSFYENGWRMLNDKPVCRQCATGSSS